MAQAFVCIPKASTGEKRLSGYGGGGGTTGGQRNASGASDVLMDAAFQNAPLTPRIADMGIGFPGGTRFGQQNGILGEGAIGKGGEEMVRKVSTGSGQSAMNSSMGRVDNYSEASPAYDRFKVGMSALMNTGGRSSWVGM
jgi:hypothetical protein